MQMFVSTKLYIFLKFSVRVLFCSLNEIYFVILFPQPFGIPVENIWDICIIVQFIPYSMINIKTYENRKTIFISVTEGGE